MSSALHHVNLLDKLKYMRLHVQDQIKFIFDRTKLHPVENLTSFIREILSFHYVPFFFYKHRIDTYAPNPVSDNRG